MILLNTEPIMSTFTRDEIVCIHYSLQINQNIFSIAIFRAPVLTQFIVKV